MSQPGQTYLESLRSGLSAAMRRYDNVLILGEDVLDPYGGAFKVTAGLSTRYPDRVLAMPISEAGLVGLGTGLAMRGFRPVAEIMFGDFLALVADQLINSAAKFPLMYRGAVRVPLLVRTPMGGGRGYGPTHSQSLEKHFLGVPGLTVVCPSTAHDPGAILIDRIASICSPVLFVEYKNLYPMRLLDNSDTDLRLRTPESAKPDDPAIVDNFSAGAPDIVVLAYGGAAGSLFAAMRRLAPEEIRVRAVVPARIGEVPDITGLVPSAIPVLFAESGTRGFDWSAEMIATLLASGALGPGHPIHRVASADDVVPAGAALEEQMHLSDISIENAIVEALQ